MTDTQTRANAYTILLNFSESEGMLMSSKPPSDESRKKAKDEPFGELMKSVNNFFNEKPVRGFLQSIDEFFKSPFPAVPSFQVEIVETGKEFIINAEMPGVKKEQIHLDILGNHLTISIEKNEEDITEDEVNQVFRRKQFRQHASRTITLPKQINEKKVKASYRDGLLQIRIPQNRGKAINIED